jgi:hypothetical protein
MSNPIKNLLRRAMDYSRVKSIPLGHGYSLSIEVVDASVSVELAVDFPFPWGGDRDHGGEPIPHYVGGVFIAPGMVAISDQRRDILWSKGKNLALDAMFRWG